MCNRTSHQLHISYLPLLEIEARVCISLTMSKQQQRPLAHPIWDETKRCTMKSGTGPSLYVLVLPTCTYLPTYQATRSTLSYAQSGKENPLRQFLEKKLSIPYIYHIIHIPYRQMHTYCGAPAHFLLEKKVGLSYGPWGGRVTFSRYCVP